MSEPWSKFYWSDYEADEGLRVCSLAAQGLWMRMLCLMARATPKGELRIAGEPCSVRDLARYASESDETVAALLDELRRRGVFSVTRVGVIFSRRMRKDAEISRKRAEIGRKGGLASLGKTKENEICSSKTQAKDEAKPKPQKPEARYSDTIVSGVPPDWRKIVFDEGLALLASAGKPEQSRRAIIGKWRKLAENDDEKLAQAIREAERRTIADPVSWMPKRLAPAPKTDLDYLIEQARRYGTA